MLNWIFCFLIFPMFVYCHQADPRDVKSSLRPRPRGQNIWPRPRPRNSWPQVNSNSVQPQYASTVCMYEWGVDSCLVLTASVMLAVLWQCTCVTEFQYHRNRAVTICSWI